MKIVTKECNVKIAKNTPNQFNIQIRIHPLSSSSTMSPQRILNSNPSLLKYKKEQTALPPIFIIQYYQNENGNKSQCYMFIVPPS